MTSIVSEGAVAKKAILTRQHYVVLVSAFLGWMFNSMDLNLFTLVLFPSVRSCWAQDARVIAQTGSLIMAIKLLCWGIGGVLFGVVADRIGRSRTMVITILIYAGFTGLIGIRANLVATCHLTGDRWLRHRRRVAAGRAHRGELARRAPRARDADHADGVRVRLFRRRARQSRLRPDRRMAPRAGDRRPARRHRARGALGGSRTGALAAGSRRDAQANSDADLRAASSSPACFAARSSAS